MGLRFSQRTGKRAIKTELEREGLSPELLNSLSPKSTFDTEVPKYQPNECS